MRFHIYDLGMGSTIVFIKCGLRKRHGSGSIRFCGFETVHILGSWKSTRVR